MTVTAWFEICDDVRTEDNGKQIRSGIYTNGILVQQFPIDLVSLFVFVTVRGPLDFAPKSIRFKISRPSMEDFFHDAPIGLGSINFPPIRDGESVHYRKVDATIPLRPCRFEKPGRMRVFAIIDGEEINAGSILIQSAQASLSDAQVAAPYVAMANLTADPDPEAVQVLRELCALMVWALVQQGAQLTRPNANVFNMPAPGGKVRSFIVKPPQHVPKAIEVTYLPEGVTATVVSLSRFGALIQLTPAVEGFLPPTLSVTYQTGDGPLA